MRIFLFSILTVVLFTVRAQYADKRPFGVITEEERQLDHCEFDSLAEAVILFDVGKSRFVNTTEGFKIKFTKHKRIKVFNEKGKEYASVRMPYYISDNRSREVIKDIKATTYNYVNGALERKEVNKAMIFEEKINENWSQKKFVFPDVQDGSIVEFSYELTTPFIFNLKDWEFQNEIPTLYSEYEVQLVPFYEYASLSQSIDSLYIYDVETDRREFNDFGVSYKYVNTKYALKNVEAFKDETFITSVNDYIKKIDFQLSRINYPDGRTIDKMTTWKSQRKSLLDDEDFGKFIKKSTNASEKILEENLDLSGLSKKDKIKQIVEYVKNSFHWNGYYGKYSRQTPKEFLKGKSGSAADINLFLIGMLRAAGINADPLILSTRNHGKINLIYPFNTSTNYVSVFIQDESIMTDGTQKLLDYNMIPTFCVNEMGLVVNKNDEDLWLSIEYRAPSIEQYAIDIKVDPEELTYTAKVNVKSTFFEAFNMRKLYGDNEEKIKNKLLEDFIDVDSIQVYGYDNSSNPYTLIYSATTEMEQLGEYLIIKPLLNLPMEENPLTLEERSYPVDFIYPYRNYYRVKIEIPEGYKILKLPSPKEVNNDAVLIQSQFLDSGKALHFLALYEFKKGVYQPKYYKLLKSSIDQIIETMNQKIYLTTE
ncbi:DUF3857 and transglutaminase domain-containing protein [Ekhidna sp.]